MTNKTEEKRVGFLTLGLGGTGSAAARPFRDLYELDGRRFPNLFVQFDTDPVPEPAADRSILIPLDGGKVETIRADAESFGPVAAAVVRHYPQYLNPEDVRNGARTIRPLTQLAFEYHRDYVLRSLRECLLALKDQGGFEVIIPVLISSSGGGTGSALQVLLPWALLDPSFKGRLCEGLGAGCLETPIAFVVEPYAHARRASEPHADKVLGNSFALRDESAELGKAGGFKYMLHLGLANDGGSVLHSPEEIARVLGTTVYQFEANWAPIKSRLVDTVDSQFSGYTGNDVPEQVLAQVRARGSAAGVRGHVSTNGRAAEAAVPERGAR